MSENNETFVFIAGLVEVMRETGIAKATVGDITLELGPPPPPKVVEEHRLLSEAEQAEVKRQRQAEFERLMYASARP